LTYPDCVENPFLHSEQKNGFLEDFEDGFELSTVEEDGEDNGDIISLFSLDDGENKLVWGGGE